jgi:hypothetical protein
MAQHYAAGVRLPKIPVRTLREAETYRARKEDARLELSELEEQRACMSPEHRPEVEGAMDTHGWDRYGYADGSGRTNLGVGRATVPRNRIKKPDWQRRMK